MFREFNRMRRDMERVFNDFDRDFPAFAPSLMDIDLVVPALTSGQQQQQQQQQTQPQPQQQQQAASGKELATTAPHGDYLQLWSQPVPAMRVDVTEKEKAFVLSAELAGVPKEAVKLQVKDNVLTIEGESKQEKKEEKENYHRMERFYGKVSRSLRLPKNIDTAHITARHENGVLTVTLPKSAEAPQQTIAIQ